ncbi:MAG: MipA/OmpV family protein, partial [Pseudomonadota bacterium]
MRALMGIAVGSSIGFAASASYAQEGAGGETVVIKRSSLAVGAAAVIKPKYEGSDEHEVIPIPMIIPKFTETEETKTSVYTQVRKRVAFRGLDDIRIRAFGGDTFQVGAVTGYITDRDQNDGDLLRGLGDVSGGFVLGAYTAATLGTFTFDAAYIEKLTGDSAGPQYRLGVETTRPVGERGSVGVRVGTTFASAEYMQTYFGVSRKQSANSKAGLPVYETDGGIKDVFISVGGTYDISDHWVVKGGVRYSRLLDEAADSPVVETSDQVSG